MENFMKKKEAAQYALVQTQRCANLIAAAVELAHDDATQAPLKRKRDQEKREVSVHDHARSAIIFLDRIGGLKPFIKTIEKSGGMRARYLRQNLKLLLQEGVTLNIDQVEVFGKRKIKTEPKE